MSLFNPVSRRWIITMFFFLQCVKIGIILSEPNSAEFKYWFYQCFQYPPYSWQCRTINGLPFPMPYSLLWYAVYTPLTSGGYWTFNLTMFTVDVLTGLLILRSYSQIYTIFWIQGSTYFLIVSPQDFLIWTMITAGRIRRIGPVMLTLAVLTKFPLLPPILDASVWGFIFNSPVSIHDPLNWSRYTVLVFYWLLSLGIWLNNRRTFNIPFIHPPVSIDTPVSRSA